MMDRCPHCKATIKDFDPLFFTTDDDGTVCISCGEVVEFNPRTGRAVKPRKARKQPTF